MTVRRYKKYIKECNVAGERPQILPPDGYEIPRPVTAFDKAPMTAVYRLTKAQIIKLTEGIGV